MKKYYTDYELPVTIRFSDMDSYGIVHHGCYFSYFEEARCAFASEILGLAYDMIDGRQIQFPVLEASCTYRHSISYEHREMLVKLDFYVENDCKLLFQYQLLNDEHKICAKAKTIHGIVEDGKICISIPEFFQNKLDLLQVK